MESQPYIPNVPVEKYKSISIEPLLEAHRRDKAFNMFKALISWLEAGLDWNKVLDAKVISTDTLASYLKCSVFKQMMNSYGPLSLALATSTYHAALQDAPWPEKIKAADRITQYHDPQWDPGVRRARVHVQGDTVQTLLKAALKSQESLEKVDPDKLTDKNTYRAIDSEQITEEDPPGNGIPIANANPIPEETEVYNNHTHENSKDPPGGSED